MARRSTATVDLRPLDRFRRQLTADLRGSGNGPVARATQFLWTERYLLYCRNRFRANSAGGGDWAPLAAATVAQDARRGTRRKGILNISSAIFNSLFRGRPGNVVLRIRNGVRVGVGGNAAHPRARTTIAKLARRHHKGDPGRNLPARPILYPPDQATKTGLVKDMAAALRTLVRKIAAVTGNASRRFR